MKREQKNAYVTNAQLLDEIGNSKATYCAFHHPYTIDFDETVADLSEITRERIQAAKPKRASRDQLRLRKEAKAQGVKPQSVAWKALARSPEDYADTDIVFRMATTEHVPDTLKRQVGKKERTDINFPAFKQFILTDNNEVVEVGRSHWLGSISNGYFSQDHGKTTNRLGLYIKRIVDRYGTRGNWRGYSYVEDMKGEALVQTIKAALKFDENKSDNPFSYYTQIISNAFIKVFNDEKSVQVTRDTILSDAGFTPSHSYQLKDYDQRTGLMK